MPVPVHVKLAQDRAKREGLAFAPGPDTAAPDMHGSASTATTASDPDPDAPTTLMLHHLPIRATIFQLFDHLDTLGLKGSYDYVHFPVDIRTRMHRGYAFVNFVTAEAARNCVARIEGTQLQATASEKKLSAGPATHQGIRANLEQMHKMVAPGPKKNRRKAAELPWLLDGGEMKPMREAPLLC